MSSLPLMLHECYKLMVCASTVRHTLLLVGLFRLSVLDVVRHPSVHLAPLRRRPEFVLSKVILYI
jgi:hypothetical protein